MNRTTVYPGHGACELCGEVDPCITCTGVQTPKGLLEKTGKTINNILEIKLNYNLQEKINTVLSSVIK
mgnify:CR=1 FL=1